MRGNDTITGVQGNDLLNGGPGDDPITGDANAAGDLTSFDRIFGAGRQRHAQAAATRPTASPAARATTRPSARTAATACPAAPATTARTAATATTSIFANRGVDTSSGGDGNDVLWALARGDVAPGPGVDQVGDTLDGGNGNDIFRTRDGEVDRITCGAGNDRALLDNGRRHHRRDGRRTRTAPASASSARRRRNGDSRSEDAQESPKEEKVTD